MSILINSYSYASASAPIELVNSAVAGAVDGNDVVSFKQA